jgi:hypothetical protein
MLSSTRPLAHALALVAVAGAAGAQKITIDPVELPRCRPQTKIEFIAPFPSVIPVMAVEVPTFHAANPNPDSWHVVLELATEQIPGLEITPVFEGFFMPSPGVAAPLPTDVNADGVMGDPHPAIPGLVLTMDDTLVFGGVPIPPGTNLASFIEMIGSESEHGKDQSTTLTWIIDPTFMIVDINGDMGTNLFTSINSAGDTVFVRHGFDPMNQGVLSTQNPTVSIWTADWISTVDSDVPADMMTPFVVGVEVRIPCYFDGTTTPPTPVPLDPIFGPCQGGTMACTGNFPPIAGPGFNPMYPSLDVRFSDDYFDASTGSFVPGGVITGGQCGVIWGSTGASLAYAFRQASVHAWYGVNGVPDTAPLGGGDDQLIYRFTMVADGMIFDTDNLPKEMLITAAVESTTNCFSITNVRVKHKPNVKTPNPGP